MSTQLPHKREIQGLRAVAVLAVILNHAFPALLPGGFIGVDIFFLISGFLITHQLLSLVKSERGLFALGIFYARRVKRILPSALLIIWVTIFLAFKYLGPVVGNETLLDGRWATIFFANSHFNSIKVDYFAQGTPAPLLQHYWSLAVEEQFYLFWPLILIVLFTLSKQSFERNLKAALLLITCASALTLLVIEPALQYFATASRIWELSIGALLATLKFSKWPRFLPWLCLVTLILSLLLIDAKNQVPGLVILPALLATALLLVNTTGLIRKLLSNPIAHYLGDISFLLYLWHWPVIELHKQLSMAPLSNQALISLILITLALSMVTHHLFENPIRYSKYLSRNFKIANLFGFATIVLSVTATQLLVKG